MAGNGAHGVVRDGLSAFEAARAVTLGKIAPLSQPQLDFAPRPGKWSIGEIADHVRLSERLYRGEIARLVALARAGKTAYLKHSFAEVNVAPLHLPNWVLSCLETPIGLMRPFVPDAVINVITEFPILPTRNPDAATPVRRRPGAELTASLKASIEETRAVIDANADLDFETMISVHPLTGANNVPQIFMFLARHERRHHGQIDGVRSDSRFPRT